LLSDNHPIYLYTLLRVTDRVVLHETWSQCLKAYYLAQDK